MKSLETFSVRLVDNLETGHLIITLKKCFSLIFVSSVCGMSHSRVN